MPKQLSIWRQLALSAVFVGAVAALWTMQDQARELLGMAAETDAPKGGRGGRETPVIVAPVTLSQDALNFEVVGTGRALRSVTLRTEASGKVVEMSLESGRRFKTGDVLLRLDDAEQRLALSLAEARFAEAERVRERFSRLEDSGAATIARLDEVKTAAQVAEIELDRAREAMDDRVIYAPFDGVAGLPSIEVGAWIDSDEEIATYDDRSALLVEFELPEALLSRIDAGMPVAASTPAFPGRSFDGVVSAIDSRVDVVSRTARARVAIPNDADLLRPGASFAVEVRLPGETYPLASELAVQFARGALHVWRVRDEVAEQIEVRLVRRRAGAVLIDGPLEEGDLLVIEGAQRLTPGRRVSIVDGAAAPALQGGGS